MKPQPFNGKVGEHSPDEDPEAAPDDGAECQPEPGVHVRVVLLEEQLSVVRPTVATWK